MVRSPSDVHLFQTSGKYLLRAPKDRVLNYKVKVPKGIILVFLSHPVTKSFKRDIEILRSSFNTLKDVEDVFFNDHPHILHSATYYPGDVYNDVELLGITYPTPKFAGIFRVPWKGTHSLYWSGTDIQFHDSKGRFLGDDLGKMQPHILSRMLEAVSKENQGKTTIVFYDGRTVRSDWWHRPKTRAAAEHSLFHHLHRQNAVVLQRRGKILHPVVDIHHAQKTEEEHRDSISKKLGRR